MPRPPPSAIRHYHHPPPPLATTTSRRALPPSPPLRPPAYGLALSARPLHRTLINGHALVAKKKKGKCVFLLKRIYRPSSTPLLQLLLVAYCVDAGVTRRLARPLRLSPSVCTCGVGGAFAAAGATAAATTATTAYSPPHPAPVSSFLWTLKAAMERRAEVPVGKHGIANPRERTADTPARALPLAMAWGRCICHDVCWQLVLVCPRGLHLLVTCRWHHICWHRVGGGR
jgi:hypothetical protein